MDIVLKQRLYEKLWKDNYYKGADVFREQMSHKEFADLITESKLAMNVVFEEMENSGETYRFLPEIFFNSKNGVGKGLATYYCFDYNVFKNLNTIDDVAASEAAMSEIAASQLAMNEIAGSSTAMNAVAGSSTAMNAVAGSSTAMNALAGSSTAMNTIAKSSTAMNIFLGSQYHVGKGIATYAGLSHSTFDSLNSMNAVTGSSTAMNAVAGSSTAMNAVAGSSTAMNAVAGSSTAMNAVAGSSTAMNSVAKSSTAMNSVAKSSTAMNIFLGSQYHVGKGIATYAGLSHSTFDSLNSMNAVTGSSTAMNALAGSSTAMNSVAKSSTAMNSVAKSSTAMNIFLGSQYHVGKGIATYAGLSHSTFDSLNSMNAVADSSTAMNAVVSSSTAMNAITKSAVAINVIVKSQMASQKVADKIQSYRSQLINTLDNGTQYFTKYSDINVGEGSGTFDECLNSSYILIPINCNDNGNDNYSVYYGADTSKRIAYIPEHFGDVSVSSGVSFRGVKVVGSGSNSGVGYVTFKKYCAK